MFYISIIQNGDHWIAVLGRNGNSLYTAEGNWLSSVSISNGKYTINGNNLYCNGVGTYSLTYGYHYEIITNEKPPTKSTITVDKATASVGEKITFTFDSDYGTEYYIWIIDTADWKTKVAQGSDLGDCYSKSKTYSISSLPAGKFYAYVTTQNSSGHLDSEGVYVEVKVPVTGVTLNRTSVTLSSIGSTEQLTSTVSPTDATDKSVTWKSSNTSVATVNSSGLVTAVGNGTATITAETVSGGMTATCAITVNVPVTGISVNKSNITLTSIGETTQLIATVTPTTAANKNVIWKSSNTSIATVDNSGLVTAVGNGTATITAETVSGGMTATCAITVNVPVTGVSVNKSNITLTSIGETTQLIATVTPTTAANKNVSWISSNTNVATVSSSGLIKAIGDGMATITVTTADGGKTASCIVIVETKTKLTIITQPSDKYVRENGYATFTIKAEGEGVIYQWQYSTDGTTWKNSGMTGAKTESIKIQGIKSRNNQQYRCVLKDKDGEQLISKAATLSVLGIAEQPMSKAIKAGEYATFTVKAFGRGLIYQWQYSTDGMAWSNSSMNGSKTETLKVQGTAMRDGQMYRCIIKDVAGNKVVSSSASLDVFAITGQPVSQAVYDGESVIFRVVAQGNGLKYQWQYSTDGTAWANSGMTGAKTDSLSVAGTIARNGQQYRCVVTDSYGKVLVSNVAKLNVNIKLAIVTQPKGQTVNEGNNATFKIVAQGNGLKYQWQYKTIDSSNWMNSGMTGAKTASLTVAGTLARNGQQYRCIITDDMGNQVTSTVVMLSVIERLAITANPKSQTVKEGASAVFNVTAKGIGLNYQWQYSTDGVTWTKSGMTGAKTSSLTVVGTTKRNGQQYRCIITDGEGKQVISEVATLTVKEALTIATQPESQTVSVGENAVFSVEVQGTGLTYQWQYSTNGTLWVKSGMTGAKTASLTVIGTTKRNGQQYRCVITDADGVEIISDMAILWVNE